jgi:hypothetical protein
MSINKLQQAKRKAELASPAGEKPKTTKKKKETIIVIPVRGNIAEFKAKVIKDFTKYSPLKVIKAFKAYYNLASARTMISLFKKELKEKTDAPDAYLSKLTLPVEDQHALRDQYAQQRDLRGTPEQILTIMYVDVILARAREWIQSIHADDNIAAIYVLSGHRFVEVFKTITIRSETQDPQPEKYPEFWGCVNGIAKQKPGAPDTCRNKLYLTPVELIIKALINIRAAYPVDGLTNAQVTSKYCKKVNTILSDRYGDLFTDHSPHVYTFRYVYGLVSYKLVGEQSKFALNQWLNRQLGHSGCVSAQIIGYQNTYLNPDGFKNYTLS